MIWPTMNGPKDMAMKGWVDISWQVVIPFALGWGFVLGDVLVQNREFELVKAGAMGLALSLASAVAFFAIAVSAGWTWPFTMSMHFIAVICMAVGIGVWSRVNPPRATGR